MIAVLSPAKSLDLSPPPPGVPSTVPDRLDESAELIESLRKLTPKQLARLMDLSPALAELNAARYCAWTRDMTAPPAKQALLTFAGDVYRGFTLKKYIKSDFTFAQNHLRILSGLHGLLRPLDLIHPYRLEMSTQLKTRRGRDLYRFWGSKISQALNTALASSGSRDLVILASDEYAAAIDPASLDGRTIHCSFRDEKSGKFKVISFFAKRARGLMADFIVRHRITKPAGLRQFATAGYRFDADASTDTTFVFLRSAQAAAAHTVAVPSP